MVLSKIKDVLCKQVKVRVIPRARWGRGARNAIFTKGEHQPTTPYLTYSREVCIGSHICSVSLCEVHKTVACLISHFRFQNSTHECLLWVMLWISSCFTIQMLTKKWASHFCFKTPKLYFHCKATFSRFTISRCNCRNLTPSGGFK